jgi:hypothetical protein
VRTHFISRACFAGIGLHCKSALAKAPEGWIDEMKRDWAAWEYAILSRCIFRVAYVHKIMEEVSHA